MCLPFLYFRQNLQRASRKNALVVLAHKSLHRRRISPLCRMLRKNIAHFVELLRCLAALVYQQIVFMVLPALIEIVLSRIKSLQNIRQMFHIRQTSENKKLCDVYKYTYRIFFFLSAVRGCLFPRGRAKAFVLRCLFRSFSALLLDFLKQS